MDNKIEVVLYDDFGSDTLKIICLSKQFGKRTVFNLYTGVAKELGQWEQVPDDFIIKVSGVLAPDLLNALATALDKRGVKTENDFKVAGLLQATKAHLADMRRLVFNYNVKEAPVKNITITQRG